MDKDFDCWNNKKKIVDKKDMEDIFFKEREIWWCHLGLNIGFEQDGKNDDFRRPVLVFKKFNKETFWAIPLTTKNKKGKYYFSFRVVSSDIDNTASLSQIRLIDSKRLIDKLGYISETDYLGIKDKIKSIIN
jgi:mRNA interferase MazF